MSRVNKPERLHPSSPSDKQDRIHQRVEIATISAAYSIALQIVLRIVTFVANAFILRFISKDILGVVNVRLLLLYTTIQFISREPFRRTCVPNTEESKSVKWEHVLNLSFLSLPASIVIGLFFSVLWFVWLEKPDETIIPHYHYGIISIFISVIIEILVEPFFIYGQRSDYIRLKVIIDGVFQLVRCLLLSSAVYISPRNAILGFAFAQLTASIIYSLCYIFFFVFIVKLPLNNFLPTYLSACFRNNSHKQVSYFDDSLWNTFLSFFKNSIFKQILTEGERYIMTVFSVVDFAEQGIFDVINNLGSLPARLVFQQIEESGYLLFSSLVNRDLKPSEQRENILKSLHICCNLVKLMLLISLILFVYGFNCAPMGLFIYGGSDLISGQIGQLAVRLLKWHCFYIVFIALNGILEAYAFAAMNAQKINRFNFKMVILSIVFSVLAYFLVPLYGSQGFIVANCFNMAVRITISVVFIGQLIPEMSISTFIYHSIPNVTSMFSFIVVFVLLNYFVQLYFTLPNLFSLIVLTIITCLIGVSHLVCLYFLETDFIAFCKAELFSRSKSKMQ